MAEVKIYDPASLSPQDWEGLQGIYRESIGSTLDRSSAELDILAGIDDPSRFYRSHVDPNTEIGRRFNFNQIYENPKVAVATEGKTVLGFAYSARNYSGGGAPEGPQDDSEKALFARELRRLSIIKNYLWLREIAVRPDQQRRGIGKQLGSTLLRSEIGIRPVTLYTWPEEIDFLEPVLKGIGFERTGPPKEVQIFGNDNDPAKQVRMQAPSVRSVLRQL